jgi:hypothetical protein
MICLAARSVGDACSSWQASAAQAWRWQLAHPLEQAGLDAPTPCPDAIACHALKRMRTSVNLP